MTNAPDRILAWTWPNKEDEGLWHIMPFQRDGMAEYLRRAPEVLAADATAQAMLAAAFDGIEERFMDAVWEALKADTNDLRKQQRILRAYRALTPADAASALARLLAEAENRILNKALAGIVARWGKAPAGSNESAGLYDATEIIRALIAQAATREGEGA